MRNAIPVVGVYGFGWPAGVIVFQIWWDGFSCLAATLGLRLYGAARIDPGFFESKRHPITATTGGRAIIGTLIWLGALLLLGAPYWFALVALGQHHEVATVFEPLLRDPSLQLLLVLVAVGNLVEEAMRGVHRLSEAEAIREFDWDFHMHLARVSLMLMGTFFFARHLVVGLALALSYVEIYPMRTLRLLGGDATLDTANQLRSPD